ncbi:hypothetical protein [Nocardia farcinica]|uniref:hypothetical protein n=1 Tax=Nocardia farcinica TaxID=37329 RepID=UPI0018963CD5|nr:hypothetical protein [Nocardia farcinica]MBF6411004.1 hypothetical protein [Nocardia farcinica]
MSDLFTQRPDGTEMMSPRAAALIYGVSVEQLTDRITADSAGARDGQSFTTSVPHLWVQNGRRRVREAAAVIGTEDMKEIVAYLDRLEGGAS